MLTIPDHAQGAAIGVGGYGSRAAIGTGARSIGSTLLPARRNAVVKSRPVPRASPSAMPARLWAVSEAGSRHIYDHPFFGLFQPFFPLVFALDLSRLE
jgi:hypothetical protein